MKALPLPVGAAFISVDSRYAVCHSDRSYYVMERDMSPGLSDPWRDYRLFEGSATECILYVESRYEPKT